MFISVLDLFKVGIGPSSSHTMGPMVAANAFNKSMIDYLQANPDLSLTALRLRCILKGSLSFTGVGHATDKAVVLGVHGYMPQALVNEDVQALVTHLWQKDSLTSTELPHITLHFNPSDDIVFDKGDALPEHPNGMIFELILNNNQGHHTTLLTKSYFSIGGGFINTLEEIKDLAAPIKTQAKVNSPYPFNSAKSMLSMSQGSALSIAAMKRQNECAHCSNETLNEALDEIWLAMKTCVEKGLTAEGILPGGLQVKRRAHTLYQQLLERPEHASMNDWLCAYAMAVNEENAAGHMVVTAPTNGAAGVIPAVIYYYYKHLNITTEQIQDYLLTASAIGGLIKHRSSISGAEVGCQGEVGSASAMAAAGVCSIRQGSSAQIENAAEIALEHHLGMTCDPVAGLVQVPCIERNGFGAIKAVTAASLALRGNGEHFMPLDSCIEAMRQTGLEMSSKYKETSLGGLAVSITEC